MGEVPEIEPNIFHRLMYEGAEFSNACRIKSYKFVICNSTQGCRSMDDTKFPWACTIHGRGCIGHLETNKLRSVVLLPCGLVPNTDTTINRYQRYKQDLEMEKIDVTDYKHLTSKIMMGKSGFIRSMNSICVEGSLKMVISIGKSGTEGTITIPETIASCTQVPCVKNGLVQYEHIKDGDYAILIRQPCLWPGGVQAVKVSVDPQIITTSGQTSWNTNWSMRIPPEMCGPYAADFDGDEMTLFVVKREESIKECKSFRWKYGTLSDPQLHQQLIPNTEQTWNAGFDEMSMRSTTCWSDKQRPYEDKFKITEAHKRLGLNVGSFVAFGKSHNSPLEFCQRAMSNMSIAASKSSLQSDVGALSRRSKLGAKKISISCSGSNQVLCAYVDTPVLPVIEHNIAFSNYSFGNPSVRAVSKLVARVMQITLKVKSTQSLESISHTMTLLSGSTS
jgi:hypothetical protein